MQLYGTFTEKGYAFQAHIPSKDGEPIGFDLRLLIDDQVKYSLLIPMLYVPSFGVDVCDGSKLEAALDKVLELLPPAEQFDATVIAALDVLEASLGGTALRKSHAIEDRVSSVGVGRFGYVEGLFAQSFASWLGGREAMDKWLGTRQQELGDRTPAEALHLGMVPDVLKLLQSQKNDHNEGASPAPIG
jgi:hypothetical protein